MITFVIDNDIEIIKYRQYQIDKIIFFSTIFGLFFVLLLLLFHRILVMKIVLHNEYSNDAESVIIIMMIIVMIWRIIMTIIIIAINSFLLISGVNHHYLELPILTMSNKFIKIINQGWCICTGEGVPWWARILWERRGERVKGRLIW